MLKNNNTKLPSMTNSNNCSGSNLLYPCSDQKNYTSCEFTSGCNWSSACTPQDSKQPNGSSSSNGSCECLHGSADWLDCNLGQYPYQEGGLITDCTKHNDSSSCYNQLNAVFNPFCTWNNNSNPNVCPAPPSLDSSFGTGTNTKSCNIQLDTGIQSNCKLCNVQLDSINQRCSLSCHCGTAEIQVSA